MLGVMTSHDESHGHGHEAGHEAGHEGPASRWARLTGGVSHAARPHSHDAADSVDSALEASHEGLRALWISLAVLGVTSLLQAVVVVISGSVALLGDTVHNLADALTAVPLAIAFTVGRRLPTRRYTYGYGRAEDLAGVAIVVTIAASAVFAAVAAVRRLADPQDVRYLGAVAAAGLIGFAGNELVARYRITVGRRIGCTPAPTASPRSPSWWAPAVSPSGSGSPTRSWDCSSRWRSSSSCGTRPVRSTAG